jgi:C4-dicarboxylate-specific signal transduction histidine kinase
MPVILFALGLVALAGEDYGLYDSRFGLAIMVTLNMVVSIALVANTARVIFRLDVKRQQAEEEIATLNESLERKVEERTRALEESLGRVKQLKGLLPICAWCKKVRDDHDYWHSVEDYVSNHTDARFSHGMCPECAKDIMPE